MNNNYLNDLNLLLDASNKMSVCALKSCNDTVIKVKENKTIATDMIKMISSTDFKEKQKLIDKISSNQDMINNELCIFNNCKEVYMNLLNILIDIYEKFSKQFPENPAFDKKNGIVKHLEKIKKISNKKKLTELDFKTLRKNKNILMMTIMSIKQQ